MHCRCPSGALQGFARPNRVSWPDSFTPAPSWTRRMDPSRQAQSFTCRACIGLDCVGWMARANGWECAGMCSRRAGRQTHGLSAARGSRIHGCLQVPQAARAALGFRCHHSGECAWGPVRHSGEAAGHLQLSSVFLALLHGYSRLYTRPARLPVILCCYV